MKTNVKKRFGFIALLKSYSWTLFIKGAIMPFVILCILTPLILLSNISTITIIEKISSIAINLLPALIGFIIGGYTILIGFGDSNFLKYLNSNRNQETTNNNHKKPNNSLYEKLNTVFAFVIIFQIVTLIFSFCIQLIIALQIKPFCSLLFVKAINHIVLFVLIFLVLYSLISVKDIVVNIFNFGKLFGVSFLKKPQDDCKS